MEKAVRNQKPGAPDTVNAKPSAPVKRPTHVPPLFRSIDWIALAFTFATVWIVYFLMLAPEQTLEDSGELCTGAFYAGIPHPPGYPVWTIYSWLWTKLLPVGNVAWRVEVGGATAAAMACGLIALMVSRGSSMLMEGIEELKNLTGKWESAICMVSGIVAGLLLGLGSVMWSESVVINRISPFGVPWVTLVLVCLLRWIYAPHQRRYLYWAMFFFGICATIHQTLLVAAMGIEVAIAVAHPRLGRNLFLGNSVLFLLGWLAQNTGLISLLDTAQMVRNLYNIIGIASILAYIGFAVFTKENLKELGRDAALAAFLLFVVATRTSMANLAVFLALVSLACFVWLAWDTRKLGLEWLVAIALGLLWILGASFYFYEPIAGMTNPPMQWGYPRTVEGFFHALSRGQYEKANPTDVFNDPNRFIMQLGILISDIAHEFNWVCVFVALVPLLFFLKMQKREKAWIGGLTAIYLCIGVLLVILMSPNAERQSAELTKVFFASSHAVIAVMFGYGLALTAAYMATHYQQFRVIGLMLGIVTLLPALITFYDGVSSTVSGTAVWMPYKSVFYLFLCLAASFVLTALAAQSYLRIAHNPSGTVQNERMFLLAFGIVALICLSLSARLAFFSKNSLSFGQVWSAVLRVFAPNQFSLPVVAGLLIVGTAVVFIGAVLLYRQRAPLLITLGLFALMPLYSGLAHWCGQRAAQPLVRLLVRP